MFVVQKKILVAMSGGVDSSAAAVLLQRQGHAVVGATMRLTADSRGAEEDARRVAEHLGIEHHVLDFREAFAREVTEPFVREYLSGRTPNPCVRCNRFLKFGALLEAGLSLGCTHMATGHYARVEYVDDRYRLIYDPENPKDQSYFLYRLTQEQLSRTIFPLTGMSKKALRQIAAEAGLPVAGKGDSQDICFIPGGNYKAYLRAHPEVDGAAETGDFVDTEGRVLGRHSGIWSYTVGQRKGIGIAAAQPYYVLGLDPERRQVILGTESELYRSEVWLEDVHWISGVTPAAGTELTAKTRYAGTPVSVELREKTARKQAVYFSEPIRAATPGQSLVFYAGHEVLGGGIISTQAP